MLRGRITSDKFRLAVFKRTETNFPCGWGTGTTKRGACGLSLAPRGPDVMKRGRGEGGSLEQKDPT